MYEQHHNETWLATLSPDLEPTHTRPPLARDPQRETQLKQDFSQRNKEADLASAKPRKEKDLIRVRKFTTSALTQVRRVYPNLRSLGLLHPLLVVLLRGFPDSFLLRMVVLIWMCLYFVYRVVDYGRHLIQLGRLVFFDDRLPDDQIVRYRLVFVRRFVPSALWTLALGWSVLEVCFNMTKLDSALCFQYTYIALSKFQTALLGQKQDLDLLLEKKNQVSSQRVVSHEVIISLLNCDTLLFATFWPLAASNVWLFSSLFVVVLAASLVLGNRWCSKRLGIPRLPIHYYTGVSSYSVLVYFLYAVGIASYIWRAFVSSDTGAIPISTWPQTLLLVYYPLSCFASEMDESLVQPQFFKDQFKAGHKALDFESSNRGMMNPEGFKAHLRVWLKETRKPVLIFNISRLTLDLLAVTVWFWPETSYMLFLLVSFVHCLSSFVATRLTSYIHILTQVITTNDSIADFIVMKEVFPKLAPQGTYPPPPPPGQNQPVEIDSTPENIDNSVDAEEPKMADPGLD